MKKVFCLLILFALLPVFAAAEQEVLLPGGRYAVDVPDRMTYSAPEAGDSGVEAYISDTLEMDYLSYPKSEWLRQGMKESLRETAEELASQGEEIELRSINGIEALCFRVTDGADGTPCIAYVFEDGETLIEINFWYATQEAADETKQIMESIRQTGGEE